MNEIDYREQLIREFAYQVYLTRIRCRLIGDEKSDWFEGEKRYEYYIKLHSPYLEK